MLRSTTSMVMEIGRSSSAGLELLAAVGSFQLHAVTKRVVEWLGMQHMQRRKRRAGNAWQVISAELVDNPVALSFLALKAPRWNPHAVVGTVSLLSASREISVDLRTMRESTPHWTLSVFRAPGMAFVAQTSSFEDPGTPEHRFAVRPGEYTIVCRYYRSGPGARFPRLSVDGEAIVEQMEIPLCVNDFFTALYEKGHWFYTAVHFHAHVMLRYRHLLPDHFVERQYLPVGNPETSFLYGAVRKGERVAVHASDEMFKHFLVFLCVYDLSSMPREYFEVTPRCKRSGAVQEDGTYLIRLHPKRPDAAAHVRHTIRIQVERAAAR